MGGGGQFPAAKKIFFLKKIKPLECYETREYAKKFLQRYPLKTLF